MKLNIPANRPPHGPPQPKPNYLGLARVRLDERLDVVHLLAEILGVGDGPGAAHLALQPLQPAPLLVQQPPQLVHPGATLLVQPRPLAIQADQAQRQLRHVTSASPKYIFIIFKHKNKITIFLFYKNKFFERVNKFHQISIILKKI